MNDVQIPHNTRPDIAASIRALSQLTDAQVCTCSAPDREQDGLIVACLKCQRVARPETLGLLRLAHALAPEGEA